MLPTYVKLVCHGKEWWKDIWHQRPGYELDLIPRCVKVGNGFEVVWGPLQLFVFWNEPKTTP